ncbi:MAG: hypothetical protein JST62_08795 [Bacteroidetes bacterium]|nr:hypothetical protein [Bacteroidota bacterium]
MTELSSEFWNTLASQLILISTLLGGFSFANLFIVDGVDAEPKLKAKLFKALTLACAGFIVSIFALTNIILLTSKGNPFSASNSNLNFPRIIGSLSFFMGLISILYVISISGRIKSYNSRKFSLIVGIIALILILLMMI